MARRAPRDAQVLKLGLGERTIVDAVDDRPRGLKRASLARSELSSSPSTSPYTVSGHIPAQETTSRRDEPGVDEPALGAALGHALSEHGSVAGRVEDDERLAEATKCVESNPSVSPRATEKGGG